MPPIKVKVRKAGDSLAITIPAQMVEDLGWRDGDIVEWEIEGNTAFIIKKKEVPKT